MEAYFLTDRGQVRDHNEDSGGYYYNEDEQLLAIIADGMGGHQAGDVASEMAVNMLQEKWEETNNKKSAEEVEDWLINVLTEINTAIYHYATENESFKGMGTTIVVAVCLKDFMTVAHVGDSRCYLNNENGFNQITEDHSLVNELVRSGELTIEEARVHPRKNVVLKALGTGASVQVDIKSITWEIGNRVLLCSDGLTDKLTNKELETFITMSPNLKQVGEDLIDLANKRGGEDNISLVLMEYSPSPEAGDPSC